MDVVDLGDIDEGMIDLVGGKALGLGRMSKSGVRVSDGLRVTAEVHALRKIPRYAVRNAYHRLGRGQVAVRSSATYDPATARIEPGDILVAPTTDPGWTPLFLTAGGLVTETGSTMAHGPTVAREYGVPAIVCYLSNDPVGHRPDSQHQRGGLA